MGANATTKRSTKHAGATDWSHLGRRTPVQIRKGIAADPAAHATDPQFWKTAKVVLPTPKELVTMRLNADLRRWFRRERGYLTAATPSCAPTWKRTSRASFLRKSSVGRPCPLLNCLTQAQSRP